HSIFSARLERNRLRDEADTNYRNLVQTSLIGGTVLAMTAVQVLDKYEYPELNWPLVARAGAIGYALPVLALRQHVKQKREADQAAVALLVATGATLLFSYALEVSKTTARGLRLTTPPGFSLLGVGAVALI
ncbi:hypothetical protein, partial [Brochothrix thermosphacta]|uniref:hypothetical protein n=1 Tax=Brochothrix thermosphacta TaxID=2756 RepID=UPI00159F108D